MEEIEGPQVNTERNIAFFDGFSWVIKPSSSCKGWTPITKEGCPNSLEETIGSVIGGYIVANGLVTTGTGFPDLIETLVWIHETEGFSLRWNIWYKDTRILYPTFSIKGRNGDSTFTLSIGTQVFSGTHVFSYDLETECVKPDGYNRFEKIQSTDIQTPLALLRLLVYTPKARDQEFVKVEKNPE